MQGHWIRTHCARFDHGGCGLKVLVDRGQAIRVLPDKANPRSKGYACAKGMSSLERIYHPQRLLNPLKRKGERGEDGRTYSLRIDGGHSFHRCTFLEDRIGREMLRTLMGALQKRNTWVLPDVIILRLLKTDNQIAGAVGLNLETCEPVMLRPKRSSWPVVAQATIT